MTHTSCRGRALVAALLLTIAVAPGVARAGTPISLSQLPAAVTKTVLDYFPRSRNLSAERDGDDLERARYKVKVRYRAIVIEVELTPQGRIVDLDMDERQSRGDTGNSSARTA